MKAIVVDPPFPQLTHLAGALGRAGELSSYIHPFLDVNGKLKQRLAGFPHIGSRIASELGRRAPMEGIPSDTVFLAGTGYELGRYALHHMKRHYGVDTRQLQERVILERNRALSKVAARHLGDADALIASFGTGLEAFEKAASKPILKVLDYPIAHYRFSVELLAAERARRPGYTRTLQDDSINPTLAKRYDRECDLADIILVGSEFAKRSFVDSGFSPDKVTVVPYGADLSMFRPNPRVQSREHFEILFVGQIGQRKGIADLFDAYRLMRTPDTLLHLVGNFVGLASAYEADRDLYVHTPHAPQHRLVGLYQRASVFVLPSHLEGMGLVVLEAMACGVPAVVSDRGPDQVVRDGIDGFVVPAGDYNALADRLSYLRDHPEVRQSMGLSAAERAKEFGWNAYTSNVRSTLAKRAP